MNPKTAPEIKRAIEAQAWADKIHYISFDHEARETTIVFKEGSPLIEAKIWDREIKSPLAAGGWALAVKHTSEKDWWKKPGWAGLDFETAMAQIKTELEWPA